MNTNRTILYGIEEMLSGFHITESYASYMGLWINLSLIYRIEKKAVHKEFMFVDVYKGEKGWRDTVANDRYEITMHHVGGDITTIKTEYYPPHEKLLDKLIDKLLSKTT